MIYIILYLVIGIGLLWKLVKEGYGFSLGSRSLDILAEIMVIVFWLPITMASLLTK